MHYDYDCDYGNDKKQDTKSFLMTMTMPERIYNSHYSNGVPACLPLSVVQLKGKHCRKPHCRTGVVDTFGL